MAMLLVLSCAAFAQRHTDQLDRGLVAMPAASGNFVSWRRQADEFYNVTYNLYRGSTNGSTKIAEGLNVTNYKDAGGSSSSTYQVEAVVNGEVQTKCAAVGLWSDYPYSLSKTHNGYLDITLATVKDRDGVDVTSHYQPNDAEMADLDGDGQLEIIIKRLNTDDATGYDSGLDDNKGKDRYIIYPQNSREFVVLDAYDVNWQTGAATLMWRIDCGPNMVSANSTEINIIAYDWDEDGKAEVVLRGADNMIVYGSNGTYTIGDTDVNTRQTWYSTDQSGNEISSMAFTNTGAEYLIYMNGQTGALYQQLDYPLTRESASAWGDNYGHRSSKYFFGAPVLDGRKASLFLGRGIYTRHKMMALDLNRGSHEWSERWSWECNDSSSPWYGNGYHNFVIADVDEDGRDEIVYGSMVIDDNGKGLSTTGYQHGDAQHVGDFDPYRKGLEFFGCLEDGPYYGSNYRNATTSEVYYKYTNTGDDGRAMMGNFSNSYPGCLGRSVGSDLISSVKDVEVVPRGDVDGTQESPNANNALYWGHLNFRIFWDGDLRDEILDSPGTGREAAVYDYESGRLFTSEGCNMNNGSKNNPCFQGDIIGDWREEIVVRCGTNLRVYTTGYETDYSLPCLWYDHQYRQAMVWQMMAYNQPPHPSFFVGEMEGITQAPPPLTKSGRTEIASGGSITSANTTPVMLCETNNMTVSVGEGAAPGVVYVNTPSWVQGTDVNGTTGTKVKSDGSVGATNLPSIETSTYTHTLTGNAFTGSTRLVKQGDGMLVLPDVTESYTGNTEIWAGSLAFSGTLSSSPVWMNRHTKFFGAPTISSSLTMEYGSTFCPSAAGITDASTASYATATIGTLNMHEGSRIVFQIDPANSLSDQVNIGTLNLRTRSGEAWENYGPDYLKPVIEIDAKSDLGNEKYTLGTLTSLNINGSPVSQSNETPIGSVVLEGAGTGQLYFYQGKLVLFFEGASSEEKVYTTLYSNDYEDAEKISDIRSGDYRDSQIEVSTNHYLKIRENGRNGGSGTMTFPSYSTDDYQEYVISFKVGFYTSNNKSSSFQIKSGSTSLATFGWTGWSSNTVSYTIGSTAQSETLSSVYQASGTRGSDTYNSITTWYTFTITGSEEAGNVTLTVNDGSNDVISNSVISNSYVAVTGFYFTLGNAHAEIGFDDMLLRTYAENEVVPNPSAAITGAYNSTRTVTMTLGSGSAQGTKIKYYTDTESKSDLTEYVNPFVVSSTSTIYYYAESTSSVKSDVQSIAVTCDPIQLASPVISDVTLNANDVDYTPTYTFENGDNSGLIGSPSATLTATFNDVPVLGFTGTFTPTQNGTLVVTSSADGYTSSQITVNCYVHYSQFWQSVDYSTLTEANMTESYPTWTKSEGGRWSGWKDKESDYTYYGVTDGVSGNNNFFTFDSYFGVRRNVLQLVEGFGIGRNNAGGETLTVVDATDDDIVALKIYNGYGNSAATTANYTVYSLRNGANVAYSLNYGRLLMQGTIYRPVTSVSKTITSAGWATYCSPYALDFSGDIDNLTDVYFVTGATGSWLNLTSVKGGTVPANTGLLFKGTAGNVVIPVVASSSTSVSANKLVGVTTETPDVAAGIYVLLNDNTYGVGFYETTDAFTVGANTAYLPANFAATTARGFYSFGDATGIKAIDNSEFTIQNSQSTIDNYYNLSGQRVAQPTKGLYIVSGKKVVVK